MRQQTLAATLGVIGVCLMVAIGIGMVAKWQTHERVQTFNNLGRGGLAPNVNFNIDLAPFAMQDFQEPCTPEQLKELRGPVMQTQEISGPFTHNNLSVFLIHGNLPGQKFLTLQQALERKLAVVHETGTGQLAVENFSPTPLFIQSGDIVKGGQQDRVLQYDLIVPSDAGRVPLTAHCVEQGRCGPRGVEPLANFRSASEQLPGRQLRLANLYRRSQADVWNNVRQTQVNLSRSVGRVEAPESPTSLQLTLENGQLRQSVQTYLDKLTPHLENRGNVVGLAVAINGRIHSADVYATPELFGAVSAKLLRAAAVEALAEPPAANLATPSIDSVKAFVTGAADGRASQHTVTGRVTMILQESDANVLFDTCDRGQQNAVVHRTILSR